MQRNNSQGLTTPAEAFTFGRADRKNNSENSG
jgi:hypothetical protein